MMHKAAKFIPFITILGCLVFSACGYSNLAQASHQVLPKRINATSEIAPSDVHTHIIITDEFYEFLQNSLGKELDQNAPTSVRMRIKNISYTPLYYDDLGYSRSFLAKLTLEFRISSGENERIITASGHYVFNSNAISTLSDDEKSLALIKASRSAFVEFATKLGALNEQNSQ